MSYLDALVPADPDPRDLLERLRSLRLTDGGQTVDLGPLDEATINLVRWVLARRPEDLWLELPRGRHDAAVVLGVFLQLMRLGARLRGPFEPVAFDGPVVVIGLNANLTERLRRIKVGAENLSEALRAQRVRADGSVTDLRSLITPADAWGDGLLYLNTSLGWPCLGQVRPGVVVIDRASFRNPDTLDRAVAWCAAHQARRVLVLSTLAEPLPRDFDEARWVRWGWTPGLRRDVEHELGHRPSCGLLSMNPLLELPPRLVGAAEYQAREFTRLRRSCLRGIAAARRTHQPFPKIIDDTVQLVNALTSLWGSVQTANECAVSDPRGTSAATLRRTVQQYGEAELGGAWAGFRETQWPDLRRDTLALYELLEVHNPRFEMLLGMLEWATVNRPGARVIVRTQNRSTAVALRQQLAEVSIDLQNRLGDEDPATSDLLVVPYADRLPWATTCTLELHLGVPAPWRRTALLSAEASEHIVAVDPDERRWLSTTLAGLETDWTAVIARAADQLDFDQPPTPHVVPARTVFGPVQIDTRGDDQPDTTLALPSIDLSRIFEGFADALTQVDSGDDDHDRPSAGTAGGRFVTARPITLEPGDLQYWLPADARVEVLLGTHYSSTPVSALTAGQSLLIPRGETRDELYTRLLQAAHRDSDVLAVTVLLQRFRAATKRLRDVHGSWDEVARQLRGRGSSVQTGRTCYNWATGSVIAPDDTLDIRRVGWLTKDDGLILNRAWERIGAIAAELRTLHRGLGRILSAAIGEAASGRRGENLRRLSELCGGSDPTEILEEFEVRKIRAVGARTTVPSGQLHRTIPVAVGAGQPA